MGLAETVKLIKLEEGCRLKSYKDSRGIWTIGWGYNLEAHGYDPDECEGMTWAQEQADRMLADEIQAVLSEIDRRWPKWRTLDEVRQAAIVSSVYQLGAPGASHFFATIRALRAHDWTAAATQMLASKWAKQTPARVKRNAEMIRTGQWPTEVNGAPFYPDGAPVVAPALAKPIAPVLPADRLQDQPGDGTTMGDAVGAVGVSVDGAVSVGGVVLSKKLCVAIVAFAAVILNEPLHIGMDYGTCKELVALACSYILGQAGVDIFKPIAAKVLGGKP